MLTAATTPIAPLKNDSPIPKPALKIKAKTALPMILPPIFNRSTMQSEVFHFLMGRMLFRHLSGGDGADHIECVKPGIVAVGQQYQMNLLVLYGHAVGC